MSMISSKEFPITWQSRDEKLPDNFIVGYITTNNSSTLQGNSMAKSILLASFIIMVTCITLAQAQVDGSWSAWNAWHTCTATCDGGVRIRFRDCDNPAPSDGGNDCPGYGMESSDCNTQGCPVDGGWTIFTAWSDCSVTCGGGTETRLRACTAPLPTNGGASCVGDSTESRSCNEDVCPTDGKWSKWGGWTECNTDCMKYRYRACDNPEPANGGRDCPGKSRENYECSLEECPVDGQWGAWSNHNCDRTCRGYKTRRCDSPPPLRGGGYCEGTNRDEYGDCTGHECVENGNWGLWTQWTKCSKTCMHGVQMRERYCTNPRPRNDGKECPEEDISHQEKPCFLQTCPVPPDYVRKVTRKQNYDINFGLILGTIFGTMAGLTVILLVTMKTRKYWLIQKRNKLVEEREQSHLYKEAAEMSIIPEGKRSAQARLRRAQLKAKLKRNGNLNEKTPLVMMDDEDGVRHRRHRPYTDTQNDSYTYVDQDNYDNNDQQEDYDNNDHQEEFDNIYHQEEFDNNDHDSQDFYDRRSGSGGDHSRGSSSDGSLSEDVYRVFAGSSGSETDLNLFNVSDSRSGSVSSESSMSDSALTNDEEILF